MLSAIFQKKIRLLAIVSGLAIVVISLMKSAMELEDAEQAYYSQWLRLGYDDQPPLYTWLQVAINKVLGVSKVSFALLRAVIFSAILLLFHQFAKQLYTNRAKALSVVLALVLIPTFIDFTFRRLSHTALLCLIVVATYYCIQKLIKNKSSLNYMLLGLAIGVGVLTKYNYALVLAALGAVLVFDDELRKVFFNIRILWVLLVTGILLTPHLLWLFGYAGFVEELQTSVATKTETSSKGIPVVSPMLSFLLTFIKLFLPLVVIGLVLFVKKKMIIKRVEASQNWIQNVCYAQLIVLILVFIVMDVQKIEARWLLPLCIPFLVLLPNYLDTTDLKQWNRIGFYLFLFCIFFQVVRTPIEKALKIPSSVHYGFEKVSEKLQTEYATKQWFLPDVTYAGNIRLLNQDREVFALDDFSLPVNELNTAEGVFIVKDKNNKPELGMLKDSILDFGKDRESLFFYVLRD